MKSKQVGPIYGVPLLDSLPLDGSTMRQALPSRSDLEGVQNYRQGLRVVAGYEVLLEHYRRLKEIVDKLPKTADGVPVVPGMKVYTRNSRNSWLVTGFQSTIDGELLVIHSDGGFDAIGPWFSTPEAAEIAKS